MIQGRTKDEVRRYDILKLIIAIILFILLLILLFSCQGQQAGAPISTPTEAAAAPTGTATEAPTEASTEAPTEAVTAGQGVLPQIISPKNGDALADGGVEISGSAAPGATVDVQVDGKSIGQVDAASDGAWSTQTTLADGDHTLQAVVSQNDGTALISEPVTVSMTGSAVVNPTITSPKDGDSLDAGQITITGTAAPGSTIEILDNDSVIGTVKAGDDGKWTFTADMAAGDHTFVARQKDTELVSAPVVVTFNKVVVNVPTGPCTIGYRDGQAYIVGNCQNLTEIAKVLDTTVDEMVNANPGIDPDVIKAGQVLNIPEGK